MPHQIDFGGAFFIESIINDFSLKITGNHSVGKISQQKLRLARQSKMKQWDRESIATLVEGREPLLLKNVVRN